MGSSNSDEAIAKKYFQGEVGHSPLVNKLNITNQTDLEKVEAYFVEHALLNGLSTKACELSADGLKQMHKELFGEIYDWAGEYRDYMTGRGLPFCKPEFIELNLNKIYKQLNQKLVENRDKKSFVKISAWFMGELNAIHPFIDGNGRTQRATLMLIAEQADITLKIDNLNQKDWYFGAEEAHIYAKYDTFEQIIRDY